MSPGIKSACYVELISRVLEEVLRESYKHKILTWLKSDRESMAILWLCVFAEIYFVFPAMSTSFIPQLFFVVPGPYHESIY